MTIVQELQLLKKFDIDENMKKLNELRGWERVFLFSIFLLLIYISSLILGLKNIIIILIFPIILILHLLFSYHGAKTPLKLIKEFLEILGYFVLFLIAISVLVLVLIGFIWVIRGFRKR